jgi:hypothetical protein
VKAKKCFNYDELKYFNKDYSKSRKSKIAEINVKNEAENSKKE